MCKLNKRNDGRRIDPCMKKLIRVINLIPNVKTILSCCGHGKYAPSLIVKYKRNSRSKLKIKEIFSGIEFSNKKKKFYKKDAQGYYYIPETINNSQSHNQHLRT